MRKTVTLVAALAAVAALALPSAGAGAAAGASKTDQTWLAGAMRTDLFEIQAGETAAKQAQGKAARKLGEGLSRAHAALFAEGKKLGAKIGVRPPTEPTRLQQGLLQKLYVVEGRRFDLTYGEEMVDGHLESIQKAKAEIAGGSSPMVKAAAKADLKMYVMHLRLARALLAEL